MGDPELRSDETVLIRTPGISVKSIPFEGILTNKRILLIDRAKNLLPPKEIPLVTIKEIEPGENAIRDQILTLSVMARTGEIRQMVLTFSRQAGGNRIKERDAWARVIRENASSPYEQVIRKVIPEPAPRSTEPAASPRYEIVHSPLHQQQKPPGPVRTAAPARDDLVPVRRAGAPIPPSPPVPPARSPEPRVPPPTLFCPKCGNRVPADSVFCNRCGSSIGGASPAAAPVQPQVSPLPLAVQPVSQAPPSVRPPSSRPIDDEIRSIEPLIERSSERVPPDPLRAAPVESLRRRPLSWDDEEEPSPSPAIQPPQEKPAGPGFVVPPIYPAETISPLAVPSAGGLGNAGDSPPPPRPPSGRSLMPGRDTLIKAGIGIVILAVIAAGALFVLPLLTSGGIALPFGSGDAIPTQTSSSSTILKPGTIVIKETPAVSIPGQGVYVHINYLGGFKGSYGISDMIANVPGNSGDRIWEVENATNSTVVASFEKLDGSGWPILVEIYRDGTLLSQGSTTVGHGSVSLSVDMVTGIAAEPVTSGIGSSTSTVTATIETSAEPTIDASVYQ